MAILVLFLSANPVDGPWLKVDQEAKEIEQKLIEGKYRDRFTLVKEPGASIDDIQGLLLQHNPNIVHFSGHGATGGIFLQGPDGKAQMLSARSLSDLFGIVNANGAIKCVLLNACYSEEQAKAISEHVDCVIGMASAVSDEAARGFAAAFYQGIAFGHSVKDSFLLGVNYLGMRGLPDEQIPKLHTLPSVDPAKVFFELGPEAPAAPVSEKPESPAKMNLVGTWNGSGAVMVRFTQAPMVIRVIFYANGTFEESGTVGGSPYYAKGIYSFDPLRNVMVVQEYGNPFPTTFFVSGITQEGFTASSPTGTLNFRRES